MGDTPIWIVPFFGMLASIALLPAAIPQLWHRRMDAIAGLWALALLVPQAIAFGPGFALAGAWNAVVSQYLPLLSLLFALYVTGGGIVIDGGGLGTPGGNTALLALGTVAASVLGTTGAAMVLIRPLLRANAHRRRRAHLPLFFILLVANAGGGLSPLGDPPLYVGFLQGVPFFWPLLHLGLPVLCVVLPLLAAFYLIDRRRARHEPPAPAPTQLTLRGGINLLLVLAVAASVVGQNVVPARSLHLLGEAASVPRLVAMAVQLAIAALSLALTPRALRQANEFAWEPMHEVTVLFAGLFITIGPVLRFVRAGAIFATAAGHQPSAAAYFWLTGLLSGFLDNAPTYLMMFQRAGGDAAALIAAPGHRLMAISAGAVLFGGLSYIGNAPNMMVRAIATQHGVRMPGFLLYVARAAALLLPCFALITLLFLR